MLTLSASKSTCPKPDPKKFPRDWMARCGLGEWVIPYLDDLAGWSRSIKQMNIFLGAGRFKPG